MNKEFVLHVFFTLISLSTFLAGSTQDSTDNTLNKNISLRLEAESSVVNNAHAEIVDDDKMSGKRGGLLERGFP